MARADFDHEYDGDAPASVEGVAAIITEILAVTGLNQTELGRKVGVRQATISRWKNDLHGPTKRQWDAVEAFIAKTPSLGHLAPHALSIDHLVAPYGDDVKRAAFSMVETFIRRLPRR